MYPTALEAPAHPDRPRDPDGVSPKPQARGGRVWLIRLGLALMSLLVPLLILEVILRLYGPVLPGNYEVGVWLHNHPIYRRFHVPNGNAWVRTPEYITRLTFNSLGLRGPEIGLEKPPGLARVMLLGDSFIEGKEVPFEQSVAAQLQALLGSRTQVLNSGVYGWGPAEEYLYLRHEGAQLQPDVVVLAFYVGNDVSNNYPRSERDRRNLTGPAFGVDRDGRLEEYPWRLPSPTWHDLIGDVLRDRLVLFRAFETGVVDKLRYERAGDAVQVTPRRMAVFQTREPRELAEAWRVVDGLIGAMQHETGRAGAALVVVAVPTRWQVHDEDWEAFLAENRLKRDDDWDLDRPAQRLARIAERRGLPMLDLRPALRQAASSGTRLYYPVDVHWTAEGHAVAAQAIRDALAAARFVAR